MIQDEGASCQDGGLSGGRYRVDKPGRLIVCIILILVSICKTQPNTETAMLSILVQLDK